jgi:hypothetical protein
MGIAVSFRSMKQDPSRHIQIGVAHLAPLLPYDAPAEPVDGEGLG